MSIATIVSIATINRATPVPSTGVFALKNNLRLFHDGLYQHYAVVIVHIIRLCISAEGLCFDALGIHAIVVNEDASDGC